VFRNSGNTAVLNINALTATNIITNPGFELNANGVAPTGWAKLQGAETTFLTDNAVAGTAHDGAESLKVVTTAAVPIKEPSTFINLLLTLTYTFSVWASVGTSGTGSPLLIWVRPKRWRADHLVSQRKTLKVATQQFNCTFTTGGTIQATDYVFVRRPSTDATIRTFYLDTATLQSTNGGFL